MDTIERQTRIKLIQIRVVQTPQETQSCHVTFFFSGEYLGEKKNPQNALIKHNSEGEKKKVKINKNPFSLITTKSKSETKVSMDAYLRKEMKTNTDNI